MKNLFLGIQAILIVLILAACEGPKKSPDNQTVGTTTDQPASEVKEAAPQSDQTNTANAETKKEESLSPTVPGTEIVENAISRLTRKLNLTETQVATMKGVFLKSFVEMGNDPNKEYPREQSQKMSLDLIKKSTNQILPYLDANQQEQFNKLGQH